MTRIGLGIGSGLLVLITLWVLLAPLDPLLEAAIGPRYDAKYLEQSENYDDIDEYQYAFIELSAR